MRTTNRPTPLFLIENCDSSRILMASATREGSNSLRMKIKNELDQRGIPLIINEHDRSFTFNISGPRHVKFISADSLEKQQSPNCTIIDGE